MTSSISVTREIYHPYSGKAGAAMIKARYIGPGLRREEYLRFEAASDWTTGESLRTSEDNGRTWSQWTLMHDHWPTRNGYTKREEPRAWCRDPVSGMSVDIVFQRILPDAGDYPLRKYTERADHNFWRVSGNDGRTWGAMHLLKYEEGADFDSSSWACPDFFEKNKMYGSYSIIPTRDGTIVYPASEIRMTADDPDAHETVDGILCFIGTWAPQRKTYDWEVSTPLRVPHRVSARGLLEPWIAELSDGRLMMVMRGSNRVFCDEDRYGWRGEVENPGRTWMATSEDGGRLWSDVTDLRFDSGEQFCSPSAHSAMLRYSVTGKLYWFGNICPEPSRGNSPRYPLVMVEVDESRPALKKETLMVVDDKHPDADTEKLQLSNFCVFENRETGEIELYLTRFGERESHWTHADACKYTILPSGCASNAWRGEIGT